MKLTLEKLRILLLYVLKELIRHDLTAIVGVLTGVAYFFISELM